MPQDINALVAGLQQIIVQLSDAAEGSREQLRTAVKSSHELILYAKAAAERTKNQQLIDFLNSIAGLIQELNSIAETPEPNANVNLSKPNQILAKLIQTYTDTVVPMLTRLSNLAKDEKTLKQVNDITRLGSEVVECSRQVYQLSGDMNTTEKLYAMLGMVLMFAGIGMLIGLTVNPATGIPMVVALTTVALGCALCRKSTARLKEKTEAVPINASLDRQRDLLEEIAENSHTKHYPKQILRFTEEEQGKPKAAATKVGVEVAPDLEHKKPEPTLMERLMGMFKRE